MAKADIRNFNSAIDAICRYSGMPIERVVDYEAGKVLESAIRYTPAADLAKIRDNFNNRTFTHFEGKIYKLSHRYPDALWGRISRQRQEHLRILKRARGLAKQSWFKLATEVGLRITAPSFVQKALPRSGKAHPENASARRFRARGRWAIEFTNSQPTATNEFVGGRRALARAMTGRVKYFEQNLRRGVFGSIKQISARYPGLVVT